ncbi:MAG: RDD family protein [Verrucomicrobia bacterium]|nr:RDD family protein [Verrucomicrobiota bacterium]MCH8514468.1 RDD family protein [Kiritimatiellia bacterium]
MWRRSLAFLIDLIPLFILAVLQNASGIEDDEIVGLINFVLLLGYYVGMDYQYGGTLGKRMVGLRVALPASPNVLGQLVSRAFVKIICFFPPLATAYGLVAIWRSDGRSFADFISGSTVVEAFSLAPPKQASVFGRIMASLLILIAPWVFLLLLMLAFFGWIWMRHWKEIAPWIPLFMMG